MLSLEARLVLRGKTPFYISTQPDRKPSADPAISSDCQAIRRKANWSLDPIACREVQRWGTPRSVTCPASRTATETIPIGILYITGSYLEPNRSEILNILRNEERAAIAKNPLERILSATDCPPHQMVVETTSEKLIPRLPRAIRKACGGVLEIPFWHDDERVRIHWGRWAAESEP